MDTQTKQNLILDIKNNLVKKAIEITSVFLIPALFLSLLRVKDSGWQPAMLIQIISSCVLLIFLIYRNIIPYLVKALAYIVIFFLLGINGIFTYGFLGTGIWLMAISIMISTVLFGARIGRIAIILMVISLLCAATFYITGFYKFSFDVEKYVFSVSSWLMQAIGVGWIMFVIVSIVGKMNSNLEENISRLLNTYQVLKNDNDKRKEYEKALCEREEMLSAMFKAAPSTMILVDKDFRIFKINRLDLFPEIKNFDDIYGLPLSELFSCRDSNSNCIDLDIFPDCIFKQTITDTLENKNSHFRIETTITVLGKTSNKDYYVLFSTSYINGMDQPVVLITLDDITEKKRAEYNLIESEEKFRNIFNLIHDGILILDLKGNFLEVNDCVLERSGIPKSEFVHLKISDIIFPSRAEETLAGFMGFVKTGQGTINSEYITRKGEHIYLELSGKLIHYQNQQAVLVLSRNVTEQRKASLALKESEERYRNIFNTVSGYIYIVNVVDNKPVSTEHGEACLVITGYTSDEFKKDPFLWIKIVHNNDQKKVVDFLNEVAEKKQLQSIEHRIFRKDGEMRWIKNHLLPHKDLDGKIIEYNGVISDITERKYLEKKMLQVAIEAEEKERGRFSKELHDGVMPILATAKLYAQTLTMCSDPQTHNEAITKIADVVIEAMQTLTEVSNNLSPHVLQNFGVVEAVNSFIAKINLTRKLEFQFLSNIKQRFTINLEVTIYRIIVELINNTIKHANAKKVTIMLNKENNIYLYYKDDGKGFNFKEVTSRNKKGMGLFNITNRVQTLEGNILIDSEGTKGTIVEVILPILNDTVNKNSIS